MLGRAALEMSEKFSLSWESFRANLGSALQELKENNDFCDVTLAAEDEQIKAHKIIISAGSPFLKKILRRNEHAHPLLYLKGIKMCDLKDLLTFMYHGQVEVSEENLGQFLEAANDLEVLGLSKDHQVKEHQLMFNRSTEMTVPINSPMTYPKKEVIQTRPLQQRKRRKFEQKESELVNYGEHFKEDILKDVENCELTNYQNEMNLDYQPVTDEVQLNEMEEKHEHIVNSEVYEEDESLDLEITNLNSELKTLYEGEDVSYNPTDIKVEENVLFDPIGEKRHGCHICPKSYKNKSDLKAHVDNHTNAFSFSCTQCGGKKFKSKNSLRMHMHNRHRGQEL